MDRVNALKDTMNEVIEKDVLLMILFCGTHCCEDLFNPWRVSKGVVLQVARKENMGRRSFDKASRNGMRTSMFVNKERERERDMPRLGYAVLYQTLFVGC